MDTIQSGRAAHAPRVVSWELPRPEPRGPQVENQKHPLFGTFGMRSGGADLLNGTQNIHTVLSGRSWRR